jgi:hypothetical protein
MLGSDVQWGIFELLGLFIYLLPLSNEDSYQVKVSIFASSPNF